MSALPQAQIEQLKVFVQLLKRQPELLHDSSLSFLREYLQSLGAKLPEQPSKPDDVDDLSSEDGPEDEAEDPQSDLELDMTGVIEPDNDEPQFMGSTEPSELSDEEVEKAELKKSEAMEAFSNGEWQKAVDLFTEAIRADSSHAAFFAKRGACFLKLNKPNACIRDCSRAIEINPDNASAYKFRGRSHRLLGEFEEAAKDLRLACRIDFDETADEWLREVTPNAKKIEEHERVKERRRQEKELKAKTKAKFAASGIPGDSKGREGGEDFLKDLLKNNPEELNDLMKAFSDPEVAAAFQDISTNRANIGKYQNNPKVMTLVNKLMSKFGPGGVPGFAGMGGAAPGGSEKTGAPKPPVSDDLD